MEKLEQPYFDYKNKLQASEYEHYWNAIIEELQTKFPKFSFPWSPINCSIMSSAINTFLLDNRLKFEEETFENLFSIKTRSKTLETFPSLETFLLRLSKVNEGIANNQNGAQKGDLRQHLRKPNKNPSNKILYYCNFSSKKDFFIKHGFIEEEFDKAIVHPIYSFVETIHEKAEYLDYVIVKQKAKEDCPDTFYKFYKELKISNKNTLKTKYDLSPEEVDFLIQLPLKLAYKYLINQEFNSISILPDSNNKFGLLAMEKFFVSPSYIPIDELNNRESLILKEIESSAHRLGQLRKESFQNFIPYDYLKSGLLNDSNKILIIGNPGVGKSTYSKWLCNEWARGKMKSKGLLLYINLSNLQFVDGKSGIIDFIARSFSWEFSYSKIEKLIHKISNDIILILDGFDELSPQGQVNLKLSLSNSKIKRYILLSRPYGLLDNTGFTWDVGIQIDGFTSNDIENYILNFLRLNEQFHHFDNLFMTISSNRVLEDYAHNPLMLSFIIFIYLSEIGEKRNSLENVHSQFELQKIVYDWMIQHEKSKGRAEDIDSMFLSATKLAYDLEKNKDLVSQGSLFDQKILEVAQYINRIGLGKLTKLQESNVWRFSFISLTFQEFFASIYLGDRISAEGFYYLSKDKFFWNFRKMLIGSILSNRRITTCKEILQHYLNEFQSNGKISNWFLYTIFLAELSPDLIRGFTKKTGVEQFYTFLIIAYSQENENWRINYYDAFRYIYSKSNTSDRKKLKELIIKELDKYLNGTNEFGIDHVKLLITELRLRNDVEFIELIIGRLKANFQIIDVPKEMLEVWFEFQFFFLQDFLLRSDILENVDQEKLDDLNAFISENFQVEKAKLSFLIEKNVGNLDENISYIELISIDPNKIEVDQIYRICSKIYKLGEYLRKSDQLFDQNDSDKIKFIVEKIIKIIELNTTDESNIDDYDIDEIGFLLINGLICFNNVSYFDSILESVYIIKPSYYTFDIPSNEEFIDFCHAEISRYKRLKDDKILFRLIESCSTILNLKNQFNLFRNEIAELMKKYVDQNHKAFSESKGGYIRSTKGASTMQLDITMNFNSVIQKQFVESQIYHHDKSFMVRSFLDYFSLSYFKNHFYPSLFSHDFEFFEPVYWEKLKSYRDNNELHHLVSILRNEKIYKYASNLVFIKDNLLYFSILNGVEDAEKMVLRITEILSKAILLLKESEEFLMSETIDEFLHLIDKLVRKYNLIEARKDIDLFLIEGGDLIVFPLMYYFTKDHYYKTEDYSSWLGSNARTLKEFMEKLISVFVYKEKLQIEKISSIYPIFEIDFTRKMRDLILHKDDITDIFIVKEFELLNNF